MLAASVTFLTPLGALVGAAVLLPLAAWRSRAVGSAPSGTALRLRAPHGGTDLVALAALVCTFALLALAATQPALSHDTAERVRTDAQTLFVLDTSRSMAAAPSRSAPTRLARAKAVAMS